MRICCLARILLKPSSLNDASNFDIKDHIDPEDFALYHVSGPALTGLQSIYYKSAMPWHILEEENLGDYQLTEIFIGYEFKENANEKLGNKKRGCFSLTDVEEGKNVFDLKIATSAIFPHFMKCDLVLRICCIKNTNVKGSPNEKEQQYYNEYAEKINQYPEATREDAFKQFPFELPNSAPLKSLKQKITDFKTLINLLGDPINGSFKNVPPSKRVENPETGKLNKLYCRFDQPTEFHVEQRTQWPMFGNPKQKYKTDVKMYKFCRALAWKRVDLSHAMLNDVNLEYLDSIKFTNMQVLIGAEPHPWFFNNQSFQNISSLELTECKMTAISDGFASLLPSTLNRLSLRDNNISSISKLIGNLKTLYNLDLYGNENLGDDGIPWEFLPTSLRIFNLSQTCITVIPEAIKRMAFLREFYVDCPNLQHVAWNEISNSIEEIYVKNKNTKLNMPMLEDKLKLRNLSICNTDLEFWMKIKEFKPGGFMTNRFQMIDCAKLPPTIRDLELENINLHAIDNLDALPVLYTLSLKNNSLKQLDWEKLSPELEFLHVQNNLLESIGNVSQLINLRTINASNNMIREIDSSIGELPDLCTLNLNKNSLSSLPMGLENIKKPLTLSLSDNRFSCNENNLTEELWNRLPALFNLEISNNNLGKVSCLRGKSIRSTLILNNCNLQWICPKIFSKAFIDAETNRKKIFIEISNNPLLTNLPIIPNTIYPPPSAKEKEERPKNDYFGLTIETDNKKFRNTEKFRTKDLEPVYDFREVEEGESECCCCKCCAICGKETEEKLFQQFMVMDAELMIRDSIPKPMREKTAECYLPGKWKTNVKSRFCPGCKERFKKYAKESFQKYLKEKPNEKKRKNKGKNDAAENLHDRNLDKPQNNETEEPTNLMEIDLAPNFTAPPENYYFVQPAPIGPPITNYVDDYSNIASNASPYNYYPSQNSTVAPVIYSTQNYQTNQNNEYIIPQDQHYAAAPEIYPNQNYIFDQQNFEHLSLGPQTQQWHHEIPQQAFLPPISAPDSDNLLESFGNYFPGNDDQSFIVDPQNY